MSDLTYHKETDQVAIIEFMPQYPFAFVSGFDEHAKPIATLLPLLVEERGDSIVLSGQLMKNMDHH